VDSVFTAIATSSSLGIANPFSKLVSVRTVADSVPFLGKNISILEMYDIHHSDMDPIFCLGPTATYPLDWSCVVAMGNTYGIPLFNHIGYDDFSPLRCNCSTNGHSKQCDKFDFLIGIALYDTSRNETVKGKRVDSFPESFRPFLPLLELFYTGTYKKYSYYNDAAFHASFAAARMGKNPALNNSTWRQEAYSWCFTESFGYCSIVMWESSDKDNHVVSEHLLQVPDGACSDSVSTSHFSNLIDLSWAPLEQDYYKCYMRSSDAAINAIGVAQGNAQIVYSVGLIVIVYISFGISSLLWPDHSDTHESKTERRAFDNQDPKASNSTNVVGQADTEHDRVDTEDDLHEYLNEFTGDEEMVKTHQAYITLKNLNNEKTSKSAGTSNERWCSFDSFT
jgi:hypothetical protein